MRFGRGYYSSAVIVVTVAVRVASDRHRRLEPEWNGIDGQPDGAFIITLVSAVVKILPVRAS